MILKFPDLDTLRLALVTGAVPPAVTQTPASAGFDDQGPVWVETADHCLARLEEPWDEVHLDHDLGGEVFVDLDREDCGMAVIRWLCMEPRPHLRSARFYVHSHNLNAAWLMVANLQAMGYHAQARPFGAHPAGFPAARGDRPPLSRRLMGWLQDLWEGPEMPRPGP